MCKKSVMPTVVTWGFIPKVAKYESKGCHEVNL